MKRRIAIISALAVAGIGTGVAMNLAQAVSTAPSQLVTIAPCRLLDTRPSSNVGERRGALTTNETITVTVTGAHGNCSIPANATGIVANATEDRGTAPSYLTLYPADVTQPLVSNVNWLPGQEPTPNQVTVGLSNDGKIKVYNLAGSVEVIIDIFGYYVPSGSPSVPGPGFLTATGSSISVTALPGATPTPAVTITTAPSGNYMVTGDVDLSTLGSPTNFGTNTACGLFRAGTLTPLTTLNGQPLLETLVPPAAGLTGSLHLNGLVNLPIVTDVVLGCTTNGTTVTVALADLALVRLGDPLVA